MSERITRFSLGDPIHEDLTDWDRIANLTDEEIDAAIADDPDCWAPTDEEIAASAARIRAQRQVAKSG